MTLYLEAHKTGLKKIKHDTLMTPPTMQKHAFKQKYFFCNILILICLNERLSFENVN